MWGRTSGYTGRPELDHMMGMSERDKQSGGFPFQDPEVSRLQRKLEDTKKYFTEKIQNLEWVKQNAESQLEREEERRKCLENQEIGLRMIQKARFKNPALWTTCFVCGTDILELPHYCCVDPIDWEKHKPFSPGAYFIPTMYSFNMCSIPCIMNSFNFNWGFKCIIFQSFSPEEMAFLGSIIAMETKATPIEELNRGERRCILPKEIRRLIIQFFRGQLKIAIKELIDSQKKLFSK